MEYIAGLLSKVIEKMKTDHDALKRFYYFGGRYNNCIQTWENATGNHLFDDHHEIFDITEHEGHVIRSIFQQGEHKDGKFDSLLFQVPSQDLIKEW